LGIVAKNGEEDVQRRPPQGIRFHRTADFVRRLNDLIDDGDTAAGGKMTAGEVAILVSEAYGYEISDSMVRKLKSASLEALPSSVLIGPICRCFGWPVPPVLDDNAELAEAASAIYELQVADHQARHRRTRRRTHGGGNFQDTQVIGVSRRTFITRYVQGVHACPFSAPFLQCYM
jgi:hypothetical protein